MSLLTGHTMSFYLCCEGPLAGSYALQTEGKMGAACRFLRESRQMYTDMPAYSASSSQSTYSSSSLDWTVSLSIDSSISLPALLATAGSFI